jgi:hypothetical protein
MEIVTAGVLGLQRRTLSMLKQVYKKEKRNKLEA